MADRCILNHSFTRCTPESFVTEAPAVLAAPPWWSCRCYEQPGRFLQQCSLPPHWSPTPRLLVSFQLWNQYHSNDYNRYSTQLRKTLHRNILAAYLLAGEPMITLWIKMPCVTSGNDGSLNFNSVMMLKRTDEQEICFQTPCSHRTVLKFPAPLYLPWCQRQHHHTNVTALGLRITKLRT